MPICLHYVVPVYSFQNGSSFYKCCNDDIMFIKWKAASGYTRLLRASYFMSNSRKLAFE